MDFAHQLRVLRKSKQISLRELSKRLRYDRAYLSRVENGASPSDELIKATATFFRVSERKLRLAAGKFPKDILNILSHYPTEAASILRESLGVYHANGDLFSGPVETNGYVPRHAQRDDNKFLNRILQGDCLHVLSQLPAASVDFIVTSPPYADNRRGTYEGVPPERYVAWFLPITQQLKRVLKPRGSFVLNIKERVVNGERHTYVLDLILRMRAQGWRWVEEYIWHKKNCYPGYWPNRFRDAWERCLHFSLQKEFRMFQDAVMVPMGDWRVSRLRNLSDTDQRRDNSRVQSGFGKRIANWLGREKAYPTNVLHMATECANRGHSATFPVALPEWFLKLFTKSGDVVLDPFMGSGTTAVACVRNGRHFVGIEINPTYRKLAEDRINIARTQLPTDPHRHATLTLQPQKI
ncbi:MAG: helix-turn-helix domain-containing protein [Candidatus Omnitrophica bacterium]|nr:helix-turn-helix domain-containing protein [Candidatus Omnitrophota bacterium]